MFTLHPQLEKDTQLLARWSLCELRWMPDAETPWLVLVPQVEDARELVDLTRPQQQQLLEEINQASFLILDHFEPDKLNLGALGNQVPQLHIHIIGRFSTDRAWPGAIWGKPDSALEGKIESKRAQILHKLQQALA